MRISDWSSDVCSSDLPAAIDWRKLPLAGDYSMIGLVVETAFHIGRLYGLTPRQADHVPLLIRWQLARFTQNDQIGRASCRESGCQYVSISVVAGQLKKTSRIKA